MAAIGLSCTPATSMRIALFNILKQRPQLVVSGINRGKNLGFGAYILFAAAIFLAFKGIVRFLGRS